MQPEVINDVYRVVAHFNECWGLRSNNEVNPENEVGGWICPCGDWFQQIGEITEHDIAKRHDWPKILTRSALEDF